MDRRKLFFFILIVLLSNNLFAYNTARKIMVTNNTNFYASGKLEYSPCSATVDKKQGVLAPHHSMTLPESIFTVCTFGCTAHFFLTNDCSGKEVASVQLSREDGISHIRNKDPAHYTIVGHGHHVAINPK